MSHLYDALPDLYQPPLADDTGPGMDVWELFERPAWQNDAACKDSDTRVFYPERGESTTEARAICASCPSREPCLEYALARPEMHGVWGGMSERQRKRMRRGRRRVSTSKYAPEFKQRAVALAMRAGVGVAAREFNIAPSLLHRWRREQTEGAA